MANYDIQGTFYEACDCEAICSCWADVPPDMGSCTGIWVWEIATGSVNGTVVNDSRLAVISYGPSCDNASQMLVLIDASSVSKFNALANAFFQPGPWRDVFSITSAIPATTDFHKAQIIIPATKDSISIKTLPGDPAITTLEAAFQIKPVQLTGTPFPPTLASRAVGKATNKKVDVGVINTPSDPSQNGLNILADIPSLIPNSPQFTFDLDVSGVTAMRGSFRYKNP